MNDRGAKRWLIVGIVLAIVVSYFSAQFNRYYLGVVRFKGIEYQGRHQPLISPTLFAEVQEVLDMHNRAGEKRRVHHHYLKGSVFCAHCGSRLCLAMRMHRQAKRRRNHRVSEVESHPPWPPLNLWFT